MKENIIWQNGHKINLEKELDVITTYIYDNEKLELVKRLDGVLDVKHVFNYIYRLKVEEAKCEFVMNNIRLGFNLVCHHAYKPVKTHNTRYYITDKITLKFKPNTSIQTIDKIIDKYALKYLRTYDERTYLLQVTANAYMNPVKVAQKIKQEHRSVLYSEVNLINRFCVALMPEDRLFPEQWHLKSMGGPELAQDADISVMDAWDITTGDRNIVVAVLDDGFDLSHPDLKGMGKVRFPKDFVNGHDNPLPDANGYHGTPCAGVAIGEMNGQGIVGVAPSCAFMPVRIPFGADPNLLFDIFDYVGKHAHVISCSWGPPPVYAPLHQLIYDKIAQLAETGGPDGKGCVIVFAAHNFNAPLKDLKNENGVRYLAGNRIYEHHDPIWNGNATHPDVVTVSACTSLNKKAAYSNWGKEVTVSAPSNNYHPIERNMRLRGRGITTTDNFQVGQHFSPNSRYTNMFGGTSSAAPVVAGVAALVKSANPDLTAKEIREIIKNTSDKIEDRTEDIILHTNKGIYDGQGHSEWFGYGRINARNAVQEAKNRMAVVIDEEDGNIVEVVNPETTTPTPSPIQVEPTAKQTNLKLQSVVQGKIDAENDSKVFKITVGSKLLVELVGADKNTDFDLYLKKGSKPTKDDYDERAITETSEEQISFDKLSPGEYYVMVNSFKGDGDFELKVSLE
ncbi:MAG: S8 family serine peptidase [Chitinophagales bacterium]